MLRKIELLVPSFLKDFDQHLLKTRPGLWATKVHYVLFFGLAGILLLLLKVAVTPISLNSVPDVFTHLAFMFVPCVLAFALYVYRISLFDVEKKFGAKAKGQDFRNQMIHLGVILLLGAIPFMYAGSLSSKVANSIENVTFDMDINALNEGEVFFPESQWKYEEDRLYANRTNFSPYRYFSSTIKSSIQLDNEIPSGKAEKLQRISDYIIAFNKYSDRPITYSPNQVLDYSNIRKVLPMASLASEKNEVETNIQRIATTKGKGIFKSFRSDELHVIVYFFMAIWMALQLFLKTSPKRFLIAVVSGMAIAGIAGSAIAISGDFFDIYEAYLLWPAFVVGLVFFIWQGYKKNNTKRTNLLKTISLIFATVMVAFFPMVTLATDKYLSDDEVFAALDIGLILVFFVWNLAFSKQFTRLQAAPLDN